MERCWISTTLYLVFNFYSTTLVHGAKILGCPFTVVKNSNLRNEEKILSILAEHGHDVYILCDSGYEPPSFLAKAGVKLFTYPRLTGLPAMKFTVTLRDITDRLRETMMKTWNLPVLSCEALLNHTKVQKMIKQEQFDLVSYQSINYCKYPIQGILGDIPSIEYMPLDGVWRNEIRELPMVQSYIPAQLYNIGQDMSFKERVISYVLTVLTWGVLQKMKYDILQLSNKYEIENRQPESLGFVFGGFPLEYPAPITPDLVYLNGILATHQPKPLDNEIEEFVQSSGEDGVIIMSFGTMISEYDEYYGELIAEAFSKMPQKVLWKYEGPMPKKLGTNTRLMKWLPQSGLLAHSKIKLFITHCGQNSMYETVMFGVPVVAMPLFGDQPQNAARLTKTHNAGVYVDLKTMTVESLVAAMTEVVSNPVYKKNAMRLSRYLNDQPIAGKDLVIYWVDYVVRHKGVSHLKPYGRFLPWCQFYSLDVLAFLSFVIFVICFISFKSCACVCRRCYKRESKTKTE